MIRVLILDDDKLYCHMLAEQLHNTALLEIHADQVSTLVEAMQLVQKQTEPYDAFLIDYKLKSSVNGIEAMRKLREQSLETETILLTGLDDPEIGLRAYQAGAFRYLPKPSKAEEVIWVLQSLIQWRETHFEREWLEVLNNIAAKTQQTMSTKQMTEELVQGGIRLGFERARLFQREPETGELLLQGVCPTDHVMVDNSEGLRIPLAQAHYVQEVLCKRDICFFDGSELGPGFPLGESGKERFPLPVGEWVGIPLLSDRENSISGILILDNADTERALRPEQRSLLTLLMRQASAGYARALRHEEQLRTSRAAVIARRIMEQTGDATNPDSFDRLLNTVRDEFSLLANADDFIVLLQGDLPTWIYTRLHVESGQGHKPYWRHISEGGLVVHMVSQGAPLFLPQGTAEYRKKHKLKAVAKGPAKSWMGVPLKIGDGVIGAMVLEDHEHPGVYTRENFELFAEIAKHLASIIQTAWLHEREHARVEQLMIIQQVNEQLMILAEQREEWLWHAMLTVITANYGFRFDRAVLLLTEQNGKSLHGSMGIGHFEWANAETDWKKDEAEGVDFNTYLRRLQANELIPTPVEKYIIGRSFDIGPPDGIFAQVLDGNGRRLVSKEEASKQLPTDFLARFGETDYAIVPVKAGEKIIGIVVLDNIWEKDPQQVGALEQIDRLTDQAALIYENLLISRAQTALIDSSYSILADLEKRSQAESLRKICDNIQDVMGADLVAIYPLLPKASNGYRHDLSNTIMVGQQSDRDLVAEYRATSFTSFILESETLVINDIDTDQGTYAGAPLDTHQFIVAEEIRALIGIPIFGINQPKHPHGVLYINYRQPRVFSAQDIRLAKSFARLAALTIRQAREYGAIRTAKKAKEEELRLLGNVLEVLEQALNFGVEERELAETLLNSTRELLKPLDVYCSLSLKIWKSSTSTSGEPMEYRRSYYSDLKGHLTGPVEIEDIFKGLTGKALRSGESLFIPDVRNEEQYKVFQERGFSTRAEIDVPIKSSGGQSIGVLTVESPSLDVLTEEHKKMLVRLAVPIGLALESVQRQNNLHTVLQATATMAEPTDLDETLDQIAQQIYTVAPDLSVLAIWHQSVDAEEEKQVVGRHYEAAALVSPKKIRYQQTEIVRTVMQGKEPRWVSRVNVDSLFKYSQFSERERIKSLTALPLWAQGKAIGAMFLSYRHIHDFTEEEKVLLPILAQTVAASINDALLLEEATKERKRHEADVEIANAIGGNVELSETLSKILERLVTLYPHVKPCILTYDEAEEMLIFAPPVHKYYPIDNLDYADLDRIPLDNTSIAGALAQVSISKQCKLMCNVGDVTRLPFGYTTRVGGVKTSFPDGYSPQYRHLHENTRSQFTITLYSERDNRLLGVLALESDQPNAFQLDDEFTIWGIAKQIRFALERSRQSEALDVRNIVTTEMFWAGEIAHDIRREIYHIRSLAEWIRQDGRLSAAGRENVAALEEIIERFANVASQHTRGLAMIDLPTSLRQWAADAIGPHKERVHLQVEPFRQKVALETFPDRLQLVVRHLVRNALHAMGHNGRITISIISATKHEVEIHFEDEGPGIKDDDKLRGLLFQQRIRTRGEGGLGLLLVHLQLENMNGTITLRPYEEDRGAVFCIKLPMKQPARRKEPK